MFYTFWLKVSAALLLTAAGAVHGIPVIWTWWSVTIIKSPHIHEFVGWIALVLGLANLIVVFVEIKNKQQ
jgi:hypothetical protein